MTAIDLFAGAGGFTTGAELAGVRVLWAANHWPAAVETHEANHPATAHLCQDLQQADWSLVPAHDLLLASPCCQGHSRARGKKDGDPQHDASRATAWAVVSAAEYHRPPLVLVENVPEFTRWTLYPAWRAAMEALGYSVSPHVVDAADHGVPQHRRRLFLVCARAKNPLLLFLPPKSHVAAETIIDSDAEGWSPVYRLGRSPRTLERITNGRATHGSRFLIAYYGAEHGGRSLARPIGTITTTDRYAIVDGERMRMLNVTEYRRAMGFPSSYQLPARHDLAVRMLGNAVCPPVAADIIEAMARVA